MTLVRAKAEGPRCLGADPASGQKVYAIHGRFGAYVQLGEAPEKGSKEKPKRSSLVGGMTESSVTLEEALELFKQPKLRRGRGQAAGRARAGHSVARLDAWHDATGGQAGACAQGAQPLAPHVCRQRSHGSGRGRSRS